MDICCLRTTGLRACRSGARLGMFVFCLCAALPAQAEQTGYYALQLNLASLHLEPAASYGRPRWNQNNAGLGLVYYFDDRRRFISVGQYKNSTYRNSVYAIYGYQIHGRAFWGGYYRLDALAGAVTNYTKPVTPLLLPQLSYEYGRGKLNMLLIPGFANTVPWTLGFAFEYTL